MKYKEYLKSDHWINVKQRVFATRYYRCYMCGKRHGLQLHHITYKNIGRERFDDLVYLCSACHRHVTFNDKDKKIADWLNLKKKEWSAPKKLMPGRFEKHKKKKIARANVIGKGVILKSEENIKNNPAGLFTWRLKQNE